MAGEEHELEGRSIYRAWRSIKRRESSLLYNALRSIHEDSAFVAEIAQLWPDLPLVANLRCGLWYSPTFHSTCYFKSTDGHSNNCSFSTARLNLHVARLAGQRGGCIIVDSTRKGKKFPDSMSKTIPIWACVLNRAIENRMGRLAMGKEQNGRLEPDDPANGSPAVWDSSLHLPLWVSKSERATIESRIDEWMEQLENSGADLDSLLTCLRKPLRPLWISQKTVIWLNEVPSSDEWDFTPIILVSASSSQGIIRQSSISQFSWHYIPGAGDDEESWARGLTPELFWKTAFEIVSWGPDLCNQKVAELVEKDRVYKAQRGENAPQIMIKCQKQRQRSDIDDIDDGSQPSKLGPTIASARTEGGSFFWIGSTNLCISSIATVASLETDVDCVMNCALQTACFNFSNNRAYLHIPIQTSKVDRFSLLINLPSAIDFAMLHLSSGKKVAVCCSNGEDISVCVSLAILVSLFDEQGNFDGGASYVESSISKWDLRKRLIFICKYAVNARPCRGNLRQVFNFLCRQRESMMPVSSSGLAP